MRAKYRPREGEKVFARYKGQNVKVVSTRFGWCQGDILLHRYYNLVFKEGEGGSVINVREGELSECPDFVRGL